LKTASVCPLKRYIGILQVPYSPEAQCEEDWGDSALVKTKAAWNASVGQSGKHSLQFQHSLAAISGMKLISFLMPLSTICFKIAINLLLLMKILFQGTGPVHPPESP